MDNMYPQPDDRFGDHTLPYGLGAGPDGLGASPGMPADGRPGNADHARSAGRRPGRIARWAAGLGITALLIGGGSVLAVHLASAAAAGSTALTGLSQPASTSQASALSDLLGAPTSAGATVLSSDSAVSGVPAGVVGALHRCVAVARYLRATGHRAAARAQLRSCIRRFLRLRLRLRLRLLGGMHGQITVKTKTGTATIAFERGVIQSVTETSIVVKAADGTTWTWDFIARTVLFHAGHRVGVAALATGQRVFVAGPIVGGADDARLILIRR
jgi:hypothetical protein